MLIEIFADFSCPWCFVGRRRLMRALAMRPRIDAEIVWQPFQLNPELPEHGTRRAEHMRSRLGHDRLQAIEVALADSGLREGIRFAFDRIRRIPNTLACHRLMRWAAGSRQENRLAEILFSAYFESGRDIGDPEILVDCAVRAGLDRSDAQHFLDGGNERLAVLSADERARQGGVAGVPYFVLDRRYAMAGAQEAIAFLPLFDALAADETAITLSPAERLSA
jgi:predicted DsbA family dithiol-disulfide isomerase